jgi:UDP-N-acetylmuramoyl-L-alanyl-D-glutamate--2,6-diaminopimelate ligase
MGGIASSLSDVTIVTSDNPRKEDPNAIIDEVMTGITDGASVFREADRRKAILFALNTATHGDVVLIAGKGHEDYQVVGETKVPFSDRNTVEEFLQVQR